MPIAINGRKICARCGIESPANNHYFSRQERRADGLNPYCKECLRVPDKERKRNRSEHKTVNGIDYKTCTICNKLKQATSEYFGRLQGKLRAHCKECARSKRGTKKRANFNDAKVVGEVMSKPCTRCHKWKPANTDHFPSFKQGKGGLHPWCRNCLRDYGRQKSEKSGARIRKKNWLPGGAIPVKRLGKIENLRKRLDEIAPREPDTAKFKAYLISNRITGENYVGITERKIVDRWRQHIWSALTGNRGYLLHDAMKHYGAENFDFFYIACAQKRHQLGQLEKQLIAQYDSVEHGYNQTRGGKAGEAKGKQVEVRGQHFISIGAAARHYKLPEPLVWQRIRVQKWSLEQALDLEPPPQIPPRRGVEITVAGVVFPTLKAASRHYGINIGAVKTRLKNGWTNEQAFGLEQPPKRGRNKGKKVTIEGKTYKSLSQAAQAFGIAASAFKSRLGSGWPPEEAAGFRKRRKRAANSRAITVEGKDYMSVRHACEVIGHNYGKIASRLQLGWTIKQAFDLAPPPAPSGEKNGKAVTVRGLTYTSKTKAAKAYGIAPSMFGKRLKLGWSIEEALGIASRAGVQRKN